MLSGKNDEFKNLITECQQYITEGSENRAESKLKETAEFWNKNKKLYRIFVDGSYCETLSESLSMAEISLKIKENTDTVKSLNECKSTLNHILDKEKLSFETVL